MSEEKEKNVKIFISYSHEDISMVKKFQTYFKPIENKYSLQLWFDEKNKAGEEFQNNIDKELNQSDIILLFISSNFLASDACKKEMKQSLKLKKEKDVIVIPIILSTCAWKETELKDLLAIPKDGKPVNDFEDENKAWDEISNNIIKHYEILNKINQIKIKNEFDNFLKDTNVFKKMHPNKQDILLDDIFVSPTLKCYDEKREYENKEIDYKDLESDILIYKNIVIAGGEQSGKTTLCKRLFLALKIRGKLPVYIFDEDKKIRGNIKNRIEKSFKDQYQINDLEYSELKTKIVPIIDNFHLAKNKQKHIDNLNDFLFSILIVDDIFDLNIENKDTIKKFKHFEIKEFLPSKRNKLIKKWLSLTDNITGNNNEEYKELERKTKIVDTTLGKIIGNGIVPSYPFFILTILSTYETANPLDENITSQGHCYQAFIYIALRKEIKNEDIDTYINFLTIIAYEFYEKRKKEFSDEDINDFLSKYETKYNLPMKKATLLKNLNETTLLIKDSLGNIHFNYDYLYFYFVAKYLSEHMDMDEHKKEINSIVNNLHKNENAYITIFISHHSKNDYILDRIVQSATGLFSEYEPATLKKKDVEFIDKNISSIIQASLPKADETAEKHREQHLKKQDEIEEDRNENSQIEEDNDPLETEIRKSIKTVEVLGRIIINRSGSLKKEQLEEIFENGLNVNLRLLASFFKLIEEEETQKYIIDFIKERLEVIIENSSKRLLDNELKEEARKIFWYLSFNVIYGYINKTIHSLGSDNLIKITNTVCDKINTPASYLIQKGILMQYCKEIDIDSIVKKLKEKDFSDSAEKVIKLMVVQFCKFNKVHFRDRQRLENKLGFTTNKLFNKTKV